MHLRCRTAKPLRGFAAAVLGVSVQELAMVGRLVALPLIFFSVCCQAAEPCLSYDPVKVLVSGHLERLTFPGRPNYESVEHGDEAEIGLYLNLPQPVCTTGESGSPDAYPQEGVISIQLVLDQSGYERLAKFIGVPIVIAGKLYARHTGHHHAPLLIKDVSLVQSDEH